MTDDALREVRAWLEQEVMDACAAIQEGGDLRHHSGRLRDLHAALAVLSLPEQVQS